MNYFIEIVGWVAALLILSAYGLLSMGKVHGSSAVYQWMNLVGAAGLVVNSGWNGAIPSAALNVVWRRSALTRSCAVAGSPDRLTKVSSCSPPSALIRRARHR